MNAEPAEENTGKRRLDNDRSIQLKLKETQETLEEIRSYLAQLCLAGSMDEKKFALNGLGECQNELDTIKSLPYEFWDALSTSKSTSLRMLIAGLEQSIPEVRYSLTNNVSPEYDEEESKMSDSETEDAAAKSAEEVEEELRAITAGMSALRGPFNSPVKRPISKKSIFAANNAQAQQPMELANTAASRVLEL
ncbi:MAG: hypothetical protein K0R24_1764 [Gammaproteobacteria bacterium]|jgi:hypothetical protein|nr:hypothetical protein [Gammaproteobacteria bacterium]